MNKPLVTIAIPCYNCCNFVEAAIKSVLNQSYTNWELLLIDDGSQDSTLSVLKQFRDPRIFLISDGENKGLPARLNESIKLARGDYYARMDADDIMRFDRIEKQVEYMLRHPNVDVLGSSAYIIDGENNILRKRVVHNADSFIHPSIMVKTSWFRRNQYDEKMLRAQDAELWLRTKHNSVFENIEDCLFYYREEGVPQLKKYIQTQMILIKYFYSFNNGYGFSIKQILKKQFIIYNKIVIFIVLNILGLSGLFLKLRNSENLCIEEFEIAKKKLEFSIKNKF